MTNNSIFTRVLALMICLVMLAGSLTACFQGTDSKLNAGTLSNDDGVIVLPTVAPTPYAELHDGSLILGTLANDVVLTAGEGVSALLPADVKIAEGATQVALSVNKVEEEVVLPLGEGDVAQSLDVHVEGIAADNTVPMTVSLGAILEAGLGATELKLYHHENGVAVPMTRVNSISEFAIHNQYYYNAETGEVIIYVASFSVFSAVKTEADVWTGESDTSWYVGHENDSEYTLTSANQFAGFRDLVDSGVTFAGKTVTLGVDIDLALTNKETGEPTSFDPIGKGYVHNGGQAFMGTFDGGSHTIYNLYQNGWDLGYSYSTVGGGLFASIKDATIKNLIVSGANIVMECIDMGTVVGYAQGKCHFENIVVTDSKLANYQRYTGGVVGEVCKGDGIEGDYTHTFVNVIVDSSVKISSLWGDFDNACGGVIGGKWGTARVLMSGVIVAAEIDAFSDVTAAYQWYAYRRCGMLIGHTEQNSPKSALNADAPFLTCENVNVFYGDWVNYTYYQFANQTDEADNRLWNSNYPWVRAEQGEHNGVLSNVRYGNPIINGVAINTVEAAEANCTAKVTITFNQLYGGGQGVYGKADHPGVTINHLSFNATTIYFEKPDAWGTELNLTYLYKNGDDTWTTVVDGFDLGNPVDTTLRDIYKVVVPTDAYSFTITDGTNEITILLEGLESDDLYAIDREGEVQHCDYDGKYHTVYFYNNKNWTKVSLYYWYANSEGTWDTLGFPGEEMTASVKDGTYDIYEFVVPSYAEAFIISNGINTGVAGHQQTVDISISGSAGKIYHIGDATTTGGTTFNVGSSTYSTGSKTIYFLNNWNWATPQYSYMGIYRNMTYVKQEGTYKTYSITIPNFVAEFKVNLKLGEESESIKSITNGATYCMYYTNNKKQFVECVKIYLDLSASNGTEWRNDSAWFAARIWNNEGDAWFKLTDTNNDKIYEGYIPQGYNNVIFCRMNKANTSKYEWSNVWNQTIDLTIGSNNCYKITNAWNGTGGKAQGSWYKK